ncbi:hypothetical protein AB0O64_17830 [Streptomyces sp. NPDC088341]|uniref:hypothetical protein n=1 Tax=Streptomyces sp. NPDC088341 TaxID=3154870 RepID=UPI0034286F52
MRRRHGRAGPGTRITHQAMAVLGEGGAVVVWAGENGVRFYAGGRSLTRSSALVEAQAVAWANQRTRLDVARAMYRLRFPDEDPAGCTRSQLLGREGEKRKRRINVDEAIGFAEVFGIDLRNLVGPPNLAAKARAMELIDAVVDAFRQTQRANSAFTKARDALDTYLAEHPDIREEADVMVSNAIAQAADSHLLEAYGPAPGDHPADENGPSGDA